MKPEIQWHREANAVISDEECRVRAPVEFVAALATCATVFFFAILVWSWWLQ